jgi:hypothetical protein
MKMKDVLYVLGLTNNFLSILALDKKCFRVAFIYGEVLMCHVIVQFVGW